VQALIVPIDQYAQAAAGNLERLINNLTLSVVVGRHETSRRRLMLEQSKPAFSERCIRRQLEEGAILLNVFASRMSAAVLGKPQCCRNIAPGLPERLPANERIN
jgi:hypothetical protein